MQYIGMDCHITTLDFAVVNDAGRLVKSCNVATGAKTVPSPRTNYVAEGAPSFHRVRFLYPFS